MGSTKSTHVFACGGKIEYMSNIEIGPIIKRARLAKEWTQEELAKHAGVSQGTIGHLESGRNRSTTKLLSIVRALGLDAVELGLQKEEDVRQPLPTSSAEGAEPTSIQEATRKRVSRLEKMLATLSSEMRELVEMLVQIDHAGGADREMTIAGIRYVLQARRDLPEDEGKTDPKLQHPSDLRKP